MAERAHSLTSAIRRALAEQADPARAAGAQAYMKSAMPYRGVSSPVLKRLYRELFAAHPLKSRAEWRAVTLQLWRGASYREERYAAIGLVDARAYAAYRTLAAVPMLEEMIVTGAWWDYVDPLATHPLGDVLVAHPERMPEMMRRWAGGSDMWKRRASILCQIRRKRETDLRLLYDCIEPNLADREFFIRKAIGWALRQYAWTDPREVARYVKANRERLSPLSVREALKNI
jgi:3-methyladenine DNA glycosylase AlkD